MICDKQTMIPVSIKTRSKLRSMKKEKPSGAMETFDEIINRLIKSDKK